MEMQAEHSGHGTKSSEHASALLRQQVKQTAAEASELNTLPSSLPATAAITIHPPASTSQQALHSLSAAGAASLGASSSHGADPESPHEPPDLSQSGRSVSEPAAEDAELSYDRTADSSSRLGGADRTSSRLPTNLSMLQFAQQSEALRYHKKTKLESFDKIIGRAPNTPHHVSLQAAPTQKAYLPQWLASPLGMQPPQHTGSAAAGIRPKEPGTGSMPASRFTTEDTELNYSPPHRNLHRDMSVRASPPQHRQQQQLHQADPNEPLTPLQAPQQGASVHSTPHPFATPSHSLVSDRYKSPRPLSRAASDTTICKSNSMAAVSPSARAQAGSGAEADSAEGSFVSLHLQTVRPTAPKPYQIAHFGQSPPPPKGEPLYASAFGIYMSVQVCVTGGVETLCLQDMHTASQRKHRCTEKDKCMSEMQANCVCMLHTSYFAIAVSVRLYLSVCLSSCVCLCPCLCLSLMSHCLSDCTMSLQTVLEVLQAGPVLRMLQECKGPGPWTHVPAALHLQGGQAQGWLRPPCATPPLLGSGLLHRRIGTPVWPASCMHLSDISSSALLVFCMHSMDQQCQKQALHYLMHCYTTQLNIWLGWAG